MFMIKKTLFIFVFYFFSYYSINLPLNDEFFLTNTTIVLTLASVSWGTFAFKQKSAIKMTLTFYFIATIN